MLYMHIPSVSKKHQNRFDSLFWTISGTSSKTVQEFARKSLTKAVQQGKVQEFRGKDIPLTNILFLCRKVWISVKVKDRIP